MMSGVSSEVQKAYDEWAEIYDTNENPTRDLNIEAIRKAPLELDGKRVLEIGCGTGLNTEFLIQRAAGVTGVDISDEMLAIARKRVAHKNVSFEIADITQTWNFDNHFFDLAVATLVLEHIKDLSHIFREAFRILGSGGIFYITELHPFRQLRQSQAKYVSKRTGKVELVRAFTHQASDYVNKGLAAGFKLIHMNEWHRPDDDIPRLITFIFEKAS